VILSYLSNKDVCTFYKLAENSLHGQVFFFQNIDYGGEREEKNMKKVNLKVMIRTIEKLTL
jgi:hypothetical protein